MPSMFSRRIYGVKDFYTLVEAKIFFSLIVKENVIQNTILWSSIITLLSRIFISSVTLTPSFLILNTSILKVFLFINIYFRNYSIKVNH